MTAPWQTLARADTAEGPLELRRRGDDWLMVIAGRVLMNSFSRSSEEDLARLAVSRLGRPASRALVSGLGMGFTLRALLDRSPATSRITVAEVNPIVVEWCSGPLGPATTNAIADPRVRVHVGDVAALITKTAPSTFDLILLDLYEGPNSASQSANDPFYSPAALARLHRALTPGGVAGIWSEDADVPFAKRFAAAGFTVTKDSIGRGGRRHIVYLGRREAAPKPPRR